MWSRIKIFGEIHPKLIETFHFYVPHHVRDLGQKFSIKDLRSKSFRFILGDQEMRRSNDEAFLRMNSLEILTSPLAKLWVK